MTQGLLKRLALAAPLVVCLPLCALAADGPLPPRRTTPPNLRRVRFNRRPRPKRRPRWATHRLRPARRRRAPRPPWAVVPLPVRAAAVPGPVAVPPRAAMAVETAAVIAAAMTVAARASTRPECLTAAPTVCRTFSAVVTIVVRSSMPASKPRCSTPSRTACSGRLHRKHHNPQHESLANGEGFDRFTFSPRITAGIQEGCWGILGRFWYLSDSSSGLNPAFPPGWRRHLLRCAAQGLYSRLRGDSQLLPGHVEGHVRLRRPIRLV